MALPNVQGFSDPVPIRPSVNEPFTVHLRIGGAKRVEIGEGFSSHSGFLPKVNSFWHLEAFFSIADVIETR